jgi:hypothetical protein
LLVNDNPIVKKSIPMEIKELGEVKVRTDLMDPVIYLYCRLHFEPILTVIHELGRNYVYVNSLIEYFKGVISETTLRRNLKEMKGLNLIEITTDTKLKISYVTLCKTALIYLTGKINNWNLRLPGKIQLDKSKCLLQIDALYEKRTFLRKSTKRYMELSKFMLALKQDLGLASVDHFNLKKMEEAHCYFVVGEKQDKWKLNFLVLDIRKFSKVTLLFRLNEVIEEIRRCLYSDMKRNEQIDNINEDLIIGVHIMTHSVFKAQILDQYFQEALIGNLSEGDRKIFEDETLEKFDLYNMEESIKITYSEI